LELVFFIRILHQIYLTMFISKVYKKNKKSDKNYMYFRLMRSYRIGNKTRQEFILNLGTLEDLPPEKHKTLADRIEQILNNKIEFYTSDKQIEELAKKFSNQIIENKKIFVNKIIEKKEIKDEDNITDFQLVDINSIDSENIKEIGCEWLAKQAVEQIGLDKIIESQNISDKLLKTSLISIISRIVHPASELETERWLKENTALNQLFDLQEDDISRYELSKANDFLYDSKEIIEKEIYTNIKNLFSLQSKIVIYDLTNIFFEGRKIGSKYCKFGRSKEKRNDCRLICLALLVDIHGFITYSHFYSGNQSEPQTLADVVTDLKTKISVPENLPVIVMDAGITTEENLKELRDKKQSYVCVSRSKLTKYEIIEDIPVIIEDKRKNKIELRKIKAEGKDDNFVYVKSEQKRVKEQSMDERFTEKFEKELDEFNQNLQKKGARRKVADVYQRMGRMKERNHYISGQYEITFSEDSKQGIVTSIQWKRKPTTNQYDGSYFIRYSNNALSTNDIWNIYNTIREVEQTFRTLKTDLQIRPVYHQNDKQIMSHIFVGIIAYQIVNTIRYQLKKHKITLSWTTLVKKLNTYKSVVTDMMTKDGKKIILKYCCRPSPSVSEIFEKLQYKIRPFRKKKFVVT
jgi:transposase